MKSNKLIFFILILISLGGLFLRIYRLGDDFILLYDQGRDLLVASNILKGKLTLLGQQAGLEGLFYGPLYYYFLAFWLFIFGGNPVGISVVIILFNLAGIYLIFLIGKQLFSEKTGLIAAFLYSISYSLIAFSRWLTNPALVPPLSLLFLYLLINLKRNKNLLYLIGIITGIVIQLEAPVAIFYPFIIIATIYFLKLRFNFRDLLRLFLPFLILVFPQILFELRHDFLSSRGILKFLFADRGFALNLRTLIYSNLGAYLNIFSDLLTPQVYIFTVILFILSFVFLILRIKSVKKSNENYKILLIIIYLPILVMLFYNRPFTPAHLIGSMPLYILLIAALIEYISRNRNHFLYLIILIFLFLNLKKYSDYENYVNYCPNSNNINLKTQKNVLDFIFNETKGQKFNYIAYTIPYWKDEAWKYLFSWYGKNKYGYIPEKGEAKSFYVIIEGDTENPAYLKNWLNNLNQKSNILMKKNINNIIVEKRKFF